MPTRRYLTTALCTETSLVVAGGLSHNVLLKSVEVMDIASKQWSTAADLPLPLTRSSVCLCEHYVYVLGGLTLNYKSSASVITCSLRDLLGSCHPGVTRRPRACTIWNRVADLPVYDSTCVSVHGRVLAMGGRDEDDNPTPAVREYQPDTNTWKVVSQMNTARYKCFAAVLSNEQVQVMVVGGAIRNRPKFVCTDEVEFASVTYP